MRFTPCTWLAAEAVLSLAIFPRVASLYFMHGVKLADPDGLLQGAGNQGGVVRLTSAGMLGDSAIEAHTAYARPGEGADAEDGARLHRRQVRIGDAAPAETVQRLTRARAQVGQATLELVGRIHGPRSKTPA